MAVPLAAGEDEGDESDLVIRPPVGWVKPDWLNDEPEPASLPMTNGRMRWVLHVLGWSLEELSRRVHTHDSSIRQMARDKRDIPDTLALWLEESAALMLSGPALPVGWRPKPT